MEFILYLHRTQQLGDAAAMHILQTWAARRPLIGSVAVKKGMLSVKDVMAIVSAQAVAPRRRFGSTAVALGLLTELDVRRLLREQARLQPEITEVFEELTGRPAQPLVEAWTGQMAA